jgi:hypothetical protein
VGLVATTVALVLGLLVASAKGFYDTQSAEITQFSANMVVLDRVLAHSGPESAEARSALRNLAVRQIEFVALPDDSSGTDSRGGTQKGEVVLDKIQELSPKDDNQPSLRAQATSVAIQLGQTRWLMFEQRTVPVPRLLLVMLVSWLAVLFISFGLYASPNLTVVVSLFFSALAVSGAIFLILAMYHPFGLIRVSGDPLRAAVAQLGQ